MKSQEVLTAQMGQYVSLHYLKWLFEVGSPQHVCYICEKTFCTGKLLSGHMNAFHKKFSCPICNQSFTLKHNLERHVGNRFAVTCKDCGKVFCNYKAYSEHEDIHHVKSVIWDIINALAKFYISDI